MALIRTYRLDGAAVHGIEDLYEQLDRLLMADAGWRLGSSLDALNDVLHGVDGPARFVWADHAHSRSALGMATTERWLQAKLDRPEVFDHGFIQRQLDDLRAGRGKTYFDLVLEVFADHPRIELDLR